MRRFRVSSFLAEVTQQIHSFRASGVMAAQRLFAAASDSMALRKSGGSLWREPRRADACSAGAFERSALLDAIGPPLGKDAGPRIGSFEYDACGTHGFLDRH